MSLLTVDQIQYNGGTALTLPTATPAAGDLLQTNGSGVLSWRDRLQKVTNAAGTVTYTTPANIQAGKALGTAGGNTMGWYSAGGDPMEINSHVGWRLGDKADFCSTINGYGGVESPGPNANVSSINLKIPSTVNASDVISYYVRGIGIGGSSGNFYLRAKPIDASNNPIAYSEIGHLLQVMASQNASQYYTGKNNFIVITNNSPNYFQQSTAQSDTTNGDFNGFGAANMSRRRQNFYLQHYNAKYDFDGTVDSYLHNDTTENRISRGSLVYQGTGNQGSFAMSTGYAAGFQFYINSGQFRNGTLELYYCLRDGV
tara:strand:+ start:754 stop:1695 length:942 start_codon:yes stop_codon:yes gene_type:complete